MRTDRFPLDLAMWNAGDDGQRSLGGRERSPAGTGEEKMAGTEAGRVATSFAMRRGKDLEQKCVRAMFSEDGRGRHRQCGGRGCACRVKHLEMVATLRRGWPLTGPPGSLRLEGRQPGAGEA